MRLPKSWTPHTIDVEPFLGEGSNGIVLGPKERVEDVYVRDVSEVVTDDTGAEVVSRAKVYLNFEDTPLTGSKVTIWPGTRHAKTGTIFKADLADHPDWPGRGAVWLK